MNAVQAYNHYRDQQILTAGPGELILILFDAAIRQICLARLAISEQNPAQSGPAFIKSQEIVDALIDSLNLDYAVSSQLMSLYDFINHELTLANIGKDDSHADSAETLLRELRDTWEQVIHGGQAMKQVISE